MVANLTPAGAAPRLPPLTAQQLLARVQQADIPGFTGDVTWTANLGLPDLGALTGSLGGDSRGFDPTSLLSGTHRFQVWAAGADRQRVALASMLAETDFVHNGDQLWQWDSATQRITHYVAQGAKAPAGAPGAAAGAAAGAGRPVRAKESGPALTPDQVAGRILDALSPSTLVTVSPPVRVAGRPAYRLELAPRPATPAATASTIGHVDIAVDAATGVPLEVAVYPAGAHPKAALDLGFSRFDPGVPPGSNFAAPTGGTVVTKALGAGTGAGAKAAAGPAGPPRSAEPVPSVVGAPWAEVVVVPAPTAAAPPASAGGLSRKELDAATTQVSGAFGTARLLQTALVNVLIFPDGRVLAGFVTPTALEAAASGAGAP